jgi:hypothetical protein
MLMMAVVTKLKMIKRKKTGSCKEKGKLIMPEKVR